MEKLRAKPASFHIRHSGLDPDRDVVLVKEGFSWPAFFFSGFWGLANNQFNPIC